MTTGSAIDRRTMLTGAALAGATLSLGMPAPAPMAIRPPRIGGGRVTLSGVDLIRLK